ncbi:MAG TPA: epoxyalkane--coenzyme M transferase, partial [Rhizomicrobium sp.]
STASPGVLDNHLPNAYYKTDDEYMEALGEAMREEYLAIHRAGHILQIDCPELASARANRYQNESIESFRKIAGRAVEVLNHATRDIPGDAMRMHVCWGNYEGPHTHDVPFKDIADIVFKARPQGILFEGANPRHEHEWEDWAKLSIPDDKILIPGVIDTTTNFVEHPHLVAQRICKYADIVGRERVIAGVDCGFSSSGGKNYRVAPSIVWAKLGALGAGAREATKRLW